MLAACPLEGLVRRPKVIQYEASQPTSKTAPLPTPKSLPAATWAATASDSTVASHGWDDRTDRQCGLLLYAAVRTGSQGRGGFWVIKIDNYRDAVVEAAEFP